jgi:ParB family chromosome partitioning protein
MKNINDRCPFGTECERKKCEHRFKESECDYYYANNTEDAFVDGKSMDDILDSYFDDEGEERMLEYIDIDLIHPHPDNPRKDVGDVSELAESIKHSGIMQNLTVVPFEGEYRVIIGHRRLAASKLAGLTELPCVVVEMSEKEQLGVMLSENMQRVDLTIVEQAQGMQLMLDMGDSVPEIAKKTGLSKATVGKRVKLTALPQDKLKAAENRGGTLEEYLKCLEVEDEKKREMLLDKVGTNNFEWNYKQEIDSQKVKKNKPIMVALLENIGAEKFKDPSDRWSSKYESVFYKSCASWDGEDFTAKLAKSEKYFYYDEGTQIGIFKKAEKKKKANTKSEKEIEADRRRKELKALFERAYSLREKFVLNFKEIKQYEKVIYEYLLKFIARSAAVFVNTDSTVLCEVSGIAGIHHGPERKEKVTQWLEKDKSAVLVLAYFRSGDMKSINCINYSYGEHYPQYTENEQLLLIYEFLGKLGYQISTEEQKLIDGTHELYAE